MTIAMFILGVLTVLSALAVVTALKPLNSALYLVLTLFFVAGHFALMGAHFVAAIQVLVYAGAIMVLVIFVIMLLGVSGDHDRGAMRGPGQLLTAIIAGCFVVVLTFGISTNLAPTVIPTEAPVKSNITTDSDNSQSFGAVLFDRFLFPFELTSILLLVAIVGAVVLAQETKRPLPPGRGLRAKQREYGTEGASKS